MSWYNPFSWVEELGQNLGMRFEKGLEEILWWAVENPEKVLAVVGSTLVGIGAYQGAKEAGKTAGTEAGKALVKIASPDKEE